MGRFPTRLPAGVLDIARWPFRLRDGFTAIGRAALAERERWPLWLPAGLGLGIGLYFALPFEPPILWAALAAFLGTAAMFAVASTHNAALRILLAAIAAITFGFALAKSRTELVAAPVLAQKVGPIALDGRVEQAELHGSGIRIVLGDIRAKRFTDADRPARIRISVRAETPLPPPGSWVHVTAVLMPPPSPAAPGAYDFGRAAYYLRLGAVGYSFGRPTIIAPLAAPSWRDRYLLLVEQLRTRMTARIHEVLPGSTGGIASALITGDRAAISDDDEQALRDAGLAHVLAIAGLHMALVGLGLFWVVRAILAAIPSLALRYPIKKWAALAALAAATFYLMISGASSASTRAFIMLATMLLAVLLDRPALSMRTLSLAAAIILLLGPESLIEPGFQMSFAAVTGLIAVAEWEAARPRAETFGPRRFQQIRRYIRGIATTSLVGSIATVPYAIYHFNRATHYAVLGNLLAMPIMGFIAMPAAALAVFLMPFGLDAWPLRVLGFGIEIMLAMGRWVSALPGAVSVMPAWPVSALVVVSLGGLWLGLWRKHWRWFGLAPLALGIALAYWTTPPNLLIARDGLTVAIRAPDGALKLFRPAKDNYSASEWLKRDGDERDTDDAVATAADRVHCDPFSCIATTASGLRIADIARIDALTEDCANAAIVVSAVPTRRHCKGPQLVIDRFDIARNNGYAVWFGPPLRVETVEQDRGARPWSAQPKPRRPQYRRISPTSLP
ncbi:MAG TPA: ComEC/Rec2 family competence protein [Rhizomicrobium sp.]|nr:ComEC/Rec2 family competence protein [Rhizomicrobium sp.]